MPPHRYTNWQQQRERVSGWKIRETWGVSGKFKNQLQLSHTQTQSTHTKSVYVVTGNVCTVSRGTLFMAKSLSQNWEKSEMNICFFIYIYCIWTEARGMERYLGARENTDALTFKKAASHSRQNHATPHPLCTARVPWCLQPPSIPVHVRLQTNTHTQTHTRKRKQCAPV